MSGAGGGQAGAAPAHRDAAGWSALDHAAGRGDLAGLGRLLADGADPLDAGPDGRTAYDIALAAGHLAAATALRAVEPSGPGTAPDHAWRPYCRAYRRGELAGFPGWPDGQHDDEVVYVHDDLTVTRSGWPGEDVLFASTSPEWAWYCRETLGFAVPDDLSLAVPHGTVDDEGESDGTGD
ncbi:hypothetical protein ACQEVC_37950 [Plantactinospora sp. CA-294935]|uniref:hypothetical protein n=1 Tax=Plantactinospora sp. CA-294935 TaxID=3240012 RepID=UPI003D915F60